MDLLNAVNKLTGQPEQKGVIRKQLDSFEETLGLDQKKESTIEKKVDETVEKYIKSQVPGGKLL